MQLQIYEWTWELGNAALKVSSPLQLSVISHFSLKIKPRERQCHQTTMMWTSL